MGCRTRSRRQRKLGAGLSECFSSPGCLVTAPTPDNRPAPGQAAWARQKKRGGGLRPPTPRSPGILTLRSLDQASARQQDKSRGRVRGGHAQDCPPSPL
eukprot:1310808-Pyramimonas_sp.AAC.1